MSLPFYQAKPVQTCKLGTVAVTLLIAIGAIFGRIPIRRNITFLLVIGVCFGLALVVVAETIYDGYRFIATNRSLREHLTDSLMITIARTIEAISVVMFVGGLQLVIIKIPDGAVPAPAGVGLFAIVIWLCVTALAGSVIRTVSEYYCYRRADKV